MTTTIDEDNHVRFRIIAITTTRAATPEVREMATVDAVWENDECSFDAGELQQLSTSADEDEDGLPACNPAHRADLVWSAAPNVLVVHDAPRAQLILPRELTGSLPWVDTYRTARVLWPGLWQPHYGLDELVKRLGLNPFIEAHMSGTASQYPAAWHAAATAALLGAQLQLASQRDSRMSPELERLALVLGPQAAPVWVQELVHVSATPAPPLRELPAPWEDDAEWASFGDEDLAWAAEDEQSICSRDDLFREIRRRQQRAERRPFPLVLCRRGSSRKL